MAINLKSLIPAPTNLANSYLFSESLEVISSTPYNLSTSTVDFLGGKDTLTTAITVPTPASPATAPTPVKGLSIQQGARMFMGLGDDDVNLSILGGSHSRGSIGLANNGSFFADSTAATAGGRDRLIINVLSDAATGIANTGLIDMGAGGDSILVTAGNNPLDLGGALDLFSAANNYGTLNSGTIRTGSGDDLFRSDAVGATSYGVYNKGLGVIDLGAGSDKLVCTVEDTKTDRGAGSYGLYNEALATIQTGLGSDRVEGISTSPGGFGIYNLGTIDTTRAVDNVTANNATSRDDSAKDIIVGDAITGLSLIPVEGYVNGGSGIYNNGIIRTGGGGDVVDAISGGFGGSGQVYLGAGRDSLLGFGAGSFYGEGDIDTLTLSPGSYNISYATFDQVNNIRPTTARSSVNAIVTEASADGVEMKIYGFEGIGGSGALAGLHFVDDLDPNKLLRSFTINANPLTGLGDVSAVVFAA